MTTRSYEGLGIIVRWDSERCQHSGNCVKGSPAVFDPEAKPWVQATAATAEEIAATIDTCPSGALSCTRTDGTRTGDAVGD